MSLFDTIKYPVNDIYDTDELDKIPRSILLSWLQDCTNITHYQISENVLIGYISPDWGVLIAHSVGWYPLTRMPGSTQAERDSMCRVLKEHFTNLLKERIKNYEE